MRILRRVFVGFVLAIVLYVVGSLLFPPLRHSIELISLLNDTIPSVLPVPVAGVQRRMLVDTWGGVRSGGRRHEGIDIFAKRGTPILSATRGIVNRVGLNQLGGNTVTVIGPGGYFHYYAHLDSYGRYEEGDKVQPGDTLGFVGTTGNAKGTPPHLHYGLYKMGGGAVNPYPYLKNQSQK